MVGFFFFVGYSLFDNRILVTPSLLHLFRYNILCSNAALSCSSVIKDLI